MDCIQRVNIEFIVDVGDEHNLLVLFLNRSEKVIVPLKMLSNAICSFSKTANMSLSFSN